MRNPDDMLDRRRVWGYTDDEQFNLSVAKQIRDDAFRPYSFTPKPYSEIEIKKDEARVREIKDSPNFRHEKSSEAVSLEYALIEAIKVSGWFGDSIQAVRKTSEYDDFVNGIDFVITFEDDDGNLFNLGVDATTSQEVAPLNTKVTRILSRLGVKQLGQVKYFEDYDGRRGLIEMPVVLLGTDGETALKLQRLFVENPDAVVDSVLQFEFLSMIEEQLRFGLEFVLRRFGIISGKIHDLYQAITVVRDSKSAIEKDKRLASLIDKYIAIIKIIGPIIREKKPSDHIRSGRKESTSFRFLSSSFGRS